MIKSIDKINKGIISHTSELVCKKYNLIFGYNGTGKTTLSKIFKDIENRTIVADNDIIDIKIEPSDNPSYIRVLYGEEYIKDNIQGDSTDSKLFSIGKKDIVLQQNKSDYEEKQKVVKEQGQVIERSKNKTIEDFGELKQSIAKEIKNTLKIHENYDRSYITKEYNSSIVYKNLGEDFASQLQKATNNTNKQNLDNFNILDNNILADIPNINGWLSTQLQEPTEFKNVFNDIITEYKKEKSEFQNFIQSGMKLDQFTNEKKCPFCFKELGELFDQFSDYFNTKEKEHKKTLEDIKTHIENKYKEREKSFNEIQDFSVFFDENREAARSIISKIISIHTSITKEEQDIIRLLDIKIKSPYKIVVVTNSSEVMENSINEYREEKEKFNKLVRDHNQRVSEFNTIKKTSQKNIKEHIFSTHQDSIHKFEIKIGEDTKNKQINIDKTKEIDELLKNINSELLYTREDIDIFNRDIKNFLGRDNIELEYSTSKFRYSLKRDGKLAGFDTFSEGEKTAISIIYFLLSLEDTKDNIKKENIIVVIDDPISSLDSNSLYSAYSFLKSKLKDVGQIFILTHHFYFFKRVQQWFTRGRRDLNPRECCLYQLKREKTTSSITKIDKHLVEFESEYQYLFNRLLQLKDRVDKGEIIAFEETVSFPNECRRILESCMSFLDPFEQKHDDRIKAIREHIIATYTGDSSELERCLDYIYRNSNTESHLQIFDDMFYFQNNPEETKLLINSMISFISEIVPHHIESYTNNNS